MLDWQVPDSTQGICLEYFEKRVESRIYGQVEFYLLHLTGK